jgi:hypothetical protein
VIITAKQTKVAEEEVRTAGLILALLGAWCCKHLSREINLDQFYYAVSRLAMEIPNYFIGWDFYALSANTIHSDELENMLQMMNNLDQVTIMSKPGIGSFICVNPCQDYVQMFPKPDLLKDLLNQFEIYLDEPIFTKHLES